MKRASSILFVTLLVLFSSCANPGIVKISPDTYMLYKTDKAGIFGNAAMMKANVIREANAFAENQGKVAIPISTQSTPMARGQFATFEYQFRVVDNKDPEAQRTSLVPRADVVIAKTEKISADIHLEETSENEVDFYTEIMKLDDLRKKGLITDAEFESEKKKLLKRSK